MSQVATRQDNVSSNPHSCDTSNRPALLHQATGFPGEERRLWGESNAGEGVGGARRRPVRAARPPATTPQSIRDRATNVAVARPSTATSREPNKQTTKPVAGSFPVNKA